MRNWVKTALFLSAFSPALLSVAAARVWAHGADWPSMYYALAGCSGFLATAYIIDAIRWNSEEFPVTIKKIEPNDALMLGVIVTYFLPLLGKAADVTPTIIIFLVLVFAIGLWFSSAILPSPLIRLMGYRFYKAESNAGVVYTLLSQRDLIDPRNVKCVMRISNSMIVEVAT